MEKTAVVKEGKTPSELSGKVSTMVKNGKALADGEEDNITPAEESLAAAMSVEYNMARRL